MHEAAIAWLALDGTGGARVEDGTVHLPGAVPGDVVRYRITHSRRRAHTGEVTEVVTPSPHRVAPPCPHHDACGGCDLAHLQHEARRTAMATAIQRMLRWDAPVPVHHAGQTAGHRARIKLTLEGTRVGYRSAGSHTLVDITEGCRIAHPRIQDALPQLRRWVAAFPDHGFEHVEVRTDGTRVVWAFPRRATHVRDQAWAPLEHVAVGGKAVAGDPVLQLPVGDLTLRASADVFFQVNLAVNDLLVGEVVRAVAAVNPERVLDLYAGIGNLGLSIAATGVPVVSVERQGQAIADLAHTAKAHGWTHIETHAAPAERFDPSRTPYHVAVVDPPRAGAGKVLARVLRNRPRRVVYVACHLPAAARDIRQHAKGYTLTAVHAFDLFPDTHHIETMMVLDRA